jgi:hypothetical protein
VRVNWTRFLKNASNFLAMGFPVCSQKEEESRLLQKEVKVVCP